jgi:capsule biosynthesis phosphatase
MHAINSFDSSALEQPLLLLDCDTIYFEDILARDASDMIGNNVIYYHHTKSLDPIFSYIQIDDIGRVTEIAEKRRISDLANTGAYQFESGNIFKKYSKYVLNKPNHYTSMIYELMIKDRAVIHSKLVEEFACVGTPFQLKAFASSINTNRYNSKTFCFDLDNCILNFPTIPGDYTTCKPKVNTVKIIRQLHAAGNTIIINTARRMKTHNNNVGRVIKDIGKITIDTLDRYSIPYDEIHFGKPLADFYIDDLAVNCYSDLEKELGFYSSHTSPRSFNSIQDNDTSIVKESNNPFIISEINWYKNIPPTLQHMFPQLISSSSNHIELEKINGITFSYLYNNCNMTVDNLQSIFDKLDTIHSCSAVYPDHLNVHDIYSNKLITRLKDTPYFEKDPVKKSINFLIDYERNLNIHNDFRVIHGDPVLTNIILECNGNIRFIDMRGSVGDIITQGGDRQYDYAKLYQSIVGYDSILEGVHTKHYLIDCFRELYLEKFSKDSFCNLQQLTAGLIFSLIPLHAKEKQNSFYDLGVSLIN